MTHGSTAGGVGKWRQAYWPGTGSIHVGARARSQSFQRTVSVMNTTKRDLQSVIALLVGMLLVLVANY
jgi:hypothetical protein